MRAFFEEVRPALFTLATISLIITIRDCFHVFGHNEDQQQTAIIPFLDYPLAVLSILSIHFGTVKDNRLFLVVGGLLLGATVLIGFLFVYPVHMIGYSLAFNIATGFSALVQSELLRQRL